MALKTVWGPITHDENKQLRDVTPRETFILGTLCVFIFVFGFASRPILEHAQATLVNLQRSVVSESPYRSRLLTMRDMTNGLYTSEKIGSVTVDTIASESPTQGER